MSVSAINPLGTQAADTASIRQDRVAAMALAKSGNTKALSKLDPEQQVKSVAGQFESILLRQFLQDSVSKMMGGEQSGAAGNMYGYMLTDVLAGKISEGGGMGLSAVIQKQLSPRPAVHAGAQKPTP